MADAVSEAQVHFPTFTPDSRAASELPPTAYVYSPLGTAQSETGLGGALDLADGL